MGIFSTHVQPFEATNMESYIEAFYFEGWLYLGASDKYLYLVIFDCCKQYLTRLSHPSTHPPIQQAF
jgi:hypothetical protein